MNYRITFPADYKNIAPLRDLAFHCARLNGFEEQASERLKAVVDELCNNAIEYGSQPTSQVILSIQAEENKIKIICQDQGHGARKTAAELRESMNEEVKSTDMRGRGARIIVKEFVDEFDIQDAKEGGIIVTAIINK